jgi:DNA-binding cell septation regulator SpoVG
MIFSRRAIMSITINEALELELLKNFKVIAGKKGLNKEIT